MPDSEIREATLDDVDALVAMWLELSADGHAADPRYDLQANAAVIARDFIENEWITDPDQFALLAYDADKPLGFITCRKSEPHRVMQSPSTFVIGDAYVAPAARRRGVGSAMVRVLIDRVAAERAAAVEVGTLAKDHRAVAFWRSQGFGDWRVSLRRDLY